MKTKIVHIRLEERARQMQYEKGGMVDVGERQVMREHGSEL